MFDMLMLILFFALLIGKVAGWLLISWWIVLLPSILIVEILLHLGGK